MRQHAAAPAQASLGGALRLERHGMPQAQPVPSETAPALDLSAVPVRNPVQFKSATGASDDALEQEADRAADQVTRMPEPARTIAPAVSRGASPAAVSMFNAPGQKLDAATRAFMEPRFGQDFSQVRVHTDVAAAKSTQAAGALAYTSGPHIAFGARQYDPISGSGRALIAHELAHVVQQRNTGMPRLQRKQPAPTTPTPAPAPQPTPAAPAQNESYSDTRIPVTLPPQPYTLVDAKAYVTQRMNATPPALTAATVSGVTAGSEAEIALWHILAAVARPSLWNTESDLIEPIGWPTKPMAPYADPSKAPAYTGPLGPAPTGAVTIRFDEKGAGSAELVSDKPAAVAQTYPDAASAKAALIATYGLKSVSDGTATWTKEDLNTAAAAFALIPGPDQAALKGVDLLRTSVIDATTAAQFATQSAVSGTVATSSATLEVADLAFASDKDAFTGSPGKTVPRSVMKLVHEVGHAVAQKAAHETHAKEMKADAAQNAAVRAYRSAPAADKPAKYTAYAAAKTNANNARAAYKKTVTPAADVKAGLAAMKTENTAGKAVQKSAETAATAYNQADTDASLAYRQAVTAVSKELSDYADAVIAGSADPKALDAAHDTAVKARDAERTNLTKAAAANPALKDFAAVETKQATWATAVQTQSRLPNRTKRVQKFVDFVNANKIAPFTQYAKDNWPHNPNEFYAEAYSLWLTDRQYLDANAPALGTWFDLPANRQ